MKKVMLFILSGVLSFLMAMPLLYTPVVQAEMGMGMGMADNMDGMRKKRYRYRNRTHRVQVGANIIPWNQNRNKNLFIDVDLLYGYNAGHFEIGPNIGFNSEGGGKINLNFEGGIWAEFNIIKNTRKASFVPSIGLKVNYTRMSNDNNLLLSPYLALKYFPASRTGLVLNLNYDIVTPFRQLFQKTEMGIAISLAYVHYFHF